MEEMKQTSNNNGGPVECHAYNLSVNSCLGLNLHYTTKTPTPSVALGSSLVLVLHMLRQEFLMLNAGQERVEHQICRSRLLSTLLNYTPKHFCGPNKMQHIFLDCVSSTFSVCYQAIKSKDIIVKIMNMKI